MASTRPDSAAGTGVRAMWISRLTTSLSKLKLLFVLVVTFFLYSATAPFPFVYDDVFQIVQNQHLESWQFLPNYFTEHVWSHVPGVPANFYRPVFLLWLRLNNVIFGHEAAGWHLTTILIHLVATGLAYLLAFRILKSRAAAFCAAAIFALHPVHVESVAWVSGVTEPLGAAFFLASFLCYLRYRGSAQLVSSLPLYAFAVLTKETAAVLPLVIVAYELTFGRQEHQESGARKGWLPGVVPYVLVLGIYLLARSMVLHGFSQKMNPEPWATSLLSWPWLLSFYLRISIWPANSSPLYNPIPVKTPAGLGFLGPLVCLLLLSALLWWWTRKHGSRLPLFCAAWFVITIAPALMVSSLALPTEAFHDRYLYLPLLGTALLVGGMVDRGLRAGNPFTRRFVTAAAIVLCGTLAMATYRQTRYWQSNYALFERASMIAPKNEIANLNFAAELVKSMEYKKALQFSRRAVLQNPQSARAQGSAAAAAFYLGDYRSAEAHYARAVAIGPSKGNLLLFLGLTRMKLGMNEAARQALQQARAVEPELRGPHYALGLLEAGAGNWRQAKLHFNAELHLDPNNTAAQAALAEADLNLGSVAQKQPRAHALPSRRENR